MKLYYVLKNISKKVALDYAHPVGEIFCTTSSTFDPNEMWGGYGLS